ncbi:Inositol 2-dehydrogenase [Stratiformator vulcanicus]|uniref:Inositol 2-dehydrogenase n=2 Tax=Stratiformator vulcanicus TaxID=2527980 RepID=A0A517QWU9_9PLAN|nr:Inositol 2-dehydrogenase [Stratiformator vulcanicus]
MHDNLMNEQSTTPRLSRRQTILGGFGTALALAWPLRAFGASKSIREADRLRVGLGGAGIRGRYLIGNLPAEAKITAICDAHLGHVQDTLSAKKPFSEVLTDFHQRDAADCTAYQDYRRMLDEESLDAVIIATPDHHHAMVALLALARGLDVYLEKPVSVTIEEGRALSDAVERTGRVLQVGSQQRSMEMNRFGCEFIRNGGLGRIHRVEISNYPGPMPCPDYRPERVPQAMNWDLFCGPTPLRPYHRRLWSKDQFKVHGVNWRGWDLWRDFSGHLVTNWGAHSFDMIQWALGKDDTGPVKLTCDPVENSEQLAADWLKKTPPPSRSPIQGRDDHRRYFPVDMQYADGTVVSLTPDNGPMRFIGEKGVAEMGRNKFSVDQPELLTSKPDRSAMALWKGAGHVARPHLQNWLDAIRHGTPLAAPIEAGHRTATVCHLINIVRELEHPLEWDPIEERFLSDEAANALIRRERRPGWELPV